jgi:hypothetical protein
MTPKAYILHQVPGRIRLRVKEKRQDWSYFEEARRRLESLSGIAEVRVNATTGTILLLHPQRPFGTLEPQLRGLELFDLREGSEPETPALAPVLKGISTVGQAIDGETSGSIDLRTLLFVALVLLAVRQMMRGDLLGPALPLLWNALEMILRPAPADTQPKV